MSARLTVLLWPRRVNSYTSSAAFDFQVPPLNSQCFAELILGLLLVVLFNNLLLLNRSRIISGLEISLPIKEENNNKKANVIISWFHLMSLLIPYQM